MKIADVYIEAGRLIHEVLRDEMRNQGHYNTGAMDESLTSEITETQKADFLDGYAIFYTRFVNDGFPAKSATYAQAPFLIKYFESKGYPIYSTSGAVTATQLAFATINKWKKEGMPSIASKRFSKTGSRTQMIENAFVGAEDRIDGIMFKGFDQVVEEEFQKEKSGIF